MTSYTYSAVVKSWSEIKLDSFFALWEKINHRYIKDPYINIKIFENQGYLDSLGTGRNWAEGRNT